jgi:hypothetical protein
MATSLSFFTEWQIEAGGGGGGGRQSKKGVVFFTHSFSTWTQLSRFFLRRIKQQKQKPKLFPLYTGAAVSVPTRDVQQQAVHCQNRLWNSAHSRLERERKERCERCY